MSPEQQLLTGCAHLFGVGVGILDALGDIQAAGHLLRVQRVARHVPQVQAPQHGPRAHALQRALRRIGVEQREAAPGCRTQAQCE